MKRGLLTWKLPGRNWSFGASNENESNASSSESVWGTGAELLRLKSALSRASKRSPMSCIMDGIMVSEELKWITGCEAHSEAQSSTSAAHEREDRIPKDMESHNSWQDL
eukprot:1271473-Rhodomonas_salina.1